jgi:hypothetical protein
MPDEPTQDVSQPGQDAHAEAPPPNEPPPGPSGAPASQGDAPSEDGTDAPPDDDPAPETVSRAELEKVIAQRQQAKVRARRAEQRVAELQAELDARGQQPAEDESSADDESAEALREQNAQLKHQLTGLLRDQALRAAAAAAGAIHPNQVVDLLRPRVRMEVGEDGRLVPTFLDADGRAMAEADGPIGDVPTFVSLFLSLPENANLVRAGVIPGSGARPGGGPAGPPGRPRSLEEFHRLPQEQRLQWALEMGPEKLRALLGMGQGQDQGFL